MPILHLPGEMIPGTIRSDQPRSPVLQKLPRLHHVERRNAFGDADDQIDFSVGGFHDRVGGKRRRNKDHSGIGAGLVDRLANCIEDRPTLVSGAAFAWRYTTDDLCAVGGAGLRVERAFAASEALDYDFCIFIN